MKNEWRPIDTAPEWAHGLFWVRPKRADELECLDTSGNLIGPHDFKPYAMLGHKRTWSSLATADWWMPIVPPGDSDNSFVTPGIPPGEEKR